MLEDRLAYYAELEKLRERPLIVYVTSARPGMPGLIGADAIPEFLDQLENLPAGAKAADLLVVSNGGDPTVAWRTITLLRERVDKVGVLVPQAAYSAATLLALGADEIVMHPNGNLGPVDPQILGKRSGEAEPQRFGFEEMASFLQFAKEKVGITDQKYLHAIFDLLSKEVGPVHVGVGARASLLSLSLGEKLLRLHMTSEADVQRTHNLAESLNKAFYHHGYPLGRKEATGIGLPIAARNDKVEQLMWKIWLDLEMELQVRKPFNPLFVLMRSSDAKKRLTEKVQQAKYPPGGPPVQVVTQLQMSKLFDGSGEVEAVEFEAIHAVMESARLASRFVTKGAVIGARSTDLNVRVGILPESSQWERKDLPRSSSPRR
jgi:hypothetical protein